MSSWSKAGMMAEEAVANLIREYHAEHTAHEQTKRELDGSAEENSRECDEIARLRNWIRHWQENGLVEDELQMALDGSPSPMCSPRTCGDV